MSIDGKSYNVPLVAVAGDADPHGNAWLSDNSAALEASAVVKASSGVLRALNIRLDATCASNTFYIQILNAASLPANGAVTHLWTPQKVVHVNGVDDYINLDFTPKGLHATLGIVVCLSSTEFTKTIGGAYLSIGALYR